jgi:murein DD-endopeptidase MepM/ murein hydrolase activator NlpD
MPLRSNKYDIIVLSDKSPEQRQFSLTKKKLFLISGGLLLALMGLILAGVAGLTSMGVEVFKTASDGVNIEELQEENKKLWLANERYLEASKDMEKKLKRLTEKTNKLSQYVGVEPLSINRDGIGGPDAFENELAQYLRYDLGLLQEDTELLEKHFETLDQAFQTQTELLDATPSILPARGWLSSGLGYRTDPFTKQRAWHNGLDISCDKGTPVYAPAKGVISFKGFQGGFGNLLEINHGNGLTTKFAHLDKFNVSKGQRVKRGDLIGYVGTTGRSTAPHLHYEIHKDEKSINPMAYIIQDNSTSY